MERCSYSKGDAKGREAATKGIESDVMTPCSTLSVSYILSTELIADAECCSFNFAAFYKLYLYNKVIYHI